MTRQSDRPADSEALREAVRTRYAAAASAVSAIVPTAANDALPVLDAGCCGPAAANLSCCSPADNGLITRDLYAVDEVADLPEAAVLASLGCGNPTALAELKPGEVVLDLGSGGGIDVLLSARRVGAAGFAYGLDMTDEMLALAERNAAAQGATNVRFLKGHIEAIPLPDSAVDVIISNCVINLAADKGQVLRQAFRVLKPGGRLAVSDVVLQGTLSDEVRHDMELWAGCVAGALEDATYRRLLADAGFADVDIEVTRVYSPDEAETPARADTLTTIAATGGRLVSAFIRATRPRVATAFPA